MPLRSPLHRRVLGLRHTQMSVMTGVCSTTFRKVSGKLLRTAHLTQVHMPHKLGNGTEGGTETRKDACKTTVHEILYCESQANPQKTACHGSSVRMPTDDPNVALCTLAYEERPDSERL